MPRAIVRPPGKNFSRALTRLAPAPAIDLDLARSQHGGYVETLRRCGVEVLVLPPDDAHPDSVFVQDRVLVVDGRAIVCPSAAPSRRGEEEAVVAAIDRSLPIVELAPPACLDGGDILVTEDSLFVGLSERSNRAAVGQLREMLAPRLAVEEVPLPADLLHLLSGCSYLGDGWLLAVASLTAVPAFRNLRRIAVPPEEAAAANALSIGKDVIVPAGYAKTAARIEGHGFRAHTVSVSEFAKRDGGVTCLSILWSSRGGPPLA
jgi:dimethylargininase